MPVFRAMWQGYAFAIDFREDRGHAYMLEDQTYTKRTQVVAQPGACMNCHASTYVAYKKAGNGDITKGFERNQPDALRRRDQAGEAPGFLHRLPRLANAGAARHPAGVHRGHARR